ncbi:MAG: TIGR01777 family oxidoreductase [Candidatus Obscuribacterales bacterium]
MKILVSGGTGLVGKKVVELLKGKGHEVKILSRRPAGDGIVHWDPGSGRIDGKKLEGYDAVVHLAGENIAGDRWSEAKKQQIRESRVAATEMLAEALAACQSPPRVLVAASAIGFYGDRGNEELTEASKPGSGFLAELCRDWEGATAPASDAGIRVVNLRIGVVIGKGGGALAKMLPPFQLGLGGPLGSGKQYMSWIANEDLAEMVLFAIEHGELSGPVNAVAPEPLTNAQFTKVLGQVISRPTLFPVPSFGLKILMGEMADELLLSSARVLPEKLGGAGFSYKHAELSSALEAALK